MDPRCVMVRSLHMWRAMGSLLWLFRSKPHEALLIRSNIEIQPVKVLTLCQWCRTLWQKEWIWNPFSLSKSPLLLTQCYNLTCEQGMKMKRNGSLRKGPFMSHPSTRLYLHITKFICLVVKNTSYSQFREFEKGKRVLPAINVKRKLNKSSSSTQLAPPL